MNRFLAVSSSDNESNEEKSNEEKQITWENVKDI